MRKDNEPRSTFGPSSQRAVRMARVFGRMIGWLSIAVGVTVLVGWLADSRALKGAIGTPITMKANPAICFVLAGASLCLSFGTDQRRRRIACLLASIVAGTGGLTLIQHSTGRDLGIDQLLFREAPGEIATASPGRMGPPASISFLCIGLSLLLLDVRTLKGRYPFRYLPLLVVITSLLSIVGYAFDSPELYSSQRVSGIAWPTAVTLLLLSLGVMTLRPDNRIIRLLCMPDIGGEAARTLLIPALAIPFVLLLAYDAAVKAARIDPTLGRGILTVTLMVTLASVVLITAHRLSLAAERQARAEKELRGREQELSDFFENASVGLHWLGPDGIILRANQADLDLLGYRRDEYVGRHIAEFHVDTKVIDDILGRLHAGENLHDIPAQLRAKDGTIKEVLIDSSVLWDDGRFVHTRCFTRDVSAQRRAELASRRLSAIVESSNDAIISKDLNGIVNSWNKAAERLFGYTAEEMIGRSITTLIPPDRADEELTILQRIRAGKRVDLYEAVRQRKNGELIDISVSISPVLDGHGRVVGASKIARDITERKRIEIERESLLEREHAARNDAERAIRVRDDFLAVVSHELRTPLSSILGWAQLLKHRGIDESLMSEGVDAIDRGARAQVQLIEDLLDMNRIMTGKLSLDVHAVQLATVIESAIATVRPATESKSIGLHAILDTRIAPVMGDPVRLQQIVWNLLSNAVKFTPKGGKINVFLRRLNSQLEITVSDTGIGIEPEFLPHVFERFRQADSSTTRAHGGLGLGLSIVKHLVELHGGTVCAQSEGKGMGAAFTVSLPQASVREQPASFRPMASTRVNEVEEVDLANVKVLVVEDDAEARELVKRVLAQRNAEVVTAASAAEALEILKTQKPDVLVSDIGMPQMDGYQFIRKVRELKPTDGGAIPAVALTAYARSEDRTKVMLAGYQMHISKPVEPQELVAIVANFAGRTQPNG